MKNIQTTTIRASEIVKDMKILVPNRPDMYVTVIEDTYPSATDLGIVMIPTEIGILTMDETLDVTVEDTEAKCDSVVNEIDREIIDYRVVKNIWRDLNETELYWDQSPDNAEELLKKVYSNLSDILWDLCLASVPEEQWERYVGRTVDVIGGPNSGRTMIIDKIYESNGYIGLIDPTGEVDNPGANPNQLILL